METDSALRFVTEEEAQILDALARCKLPAHSADLRFVLEMQYAAHNGLKLMNTGREAYLRRIAYRYRDRLPPEIRTAAAG